MSGSFDSAWLKWGWGVVHAQALERAVRVEMENFKTRQPYVARTEYSPKHRCVRLFIESIDPLPPSLGLRIGDVANNFRSALDHLAWTLVATRPRTPLQRKHANRIYFPIAADKKAFNDHLTVSYLRRGDRAILRRYQPYIYGRRKMPLHCLTPLPDLNSDDKHRLIRPVWAWPRSGKLYHGDPVDCAVTRIPDQARGIVRGPGAEIHRIYVRRTGPNPDVYMKAELSVQPLLAGRISILEWLTQATAHIRDLLRDFAEPPDEILTLGIIPGGQPPSGPMGRGAKSQPSPSKG